MAPIRPVRKAVIPVAGNGTRFLPATKAMPKEMLTIVDRPVVQYAVEEAMQAGIEHIVFVTGRNKQAIEDHFDDVPELISSLTRSGKDAQLSELARMLPTAGSVSFTRQQAPLGLGHAVWWRPRPDRRRAVCAAFARHDLLRRARLHGRSDGPL